MAGCCMMAGVACQAYELAPPPTENQDPGRRAGEGQDSAEVADRVVTDAASRRR